MNDRRCYSGTRMRVPSSRHTPTSGDKGVHMSKGKEELIGRAVIDEEFRARLLADPAGTIAAEGYEVDQELIDQLTNLDPEAAAAAAKGLDAAFADRKAAS